MEEIPEAVNFGDLTLHSCCHCRQIEVACQDKNFWIRRRNTDKEECKFTYDEVQRARNGGCDLFRQRLQALQQHQKFTTLDQRRLFLWIFTTPIDGNDFAYIEFWWQDYSPIFAKKPKDPEDILEETKYVLSLEGTHFSPFTRHDANI